VSTFKVPVTTIQDILPHPNADRLSVAKIYDWMVVIQKDLYKVGQPIIYIPVDSILPVDLEEKLFPPDSKIKLTKSRVKSIKIRGAISQGMIVDLHHTGLVIDKNCKLEEDVSSILQVKKYEPAKESLPSKLNVKKSKKQSNRYFCKYTDIENIKWYNNLFTENEPVVMTTKLHGTNARYGWVPFDANTLYRKILKFFGFLPKWQFVWGSHNVQIHDKSEHKGFYEEDVYSKIFRQYNLDAKIPEGYVVYGEIVGDGIQKNFNYGCARGEYKLYIFDIMFVDEDGTHKYLDHWDFIDMAERMELPVVPIVYVGPFNINQANILVGQNPLSNETNEGLVIKSINEKISPIGRKIVKMINPDYYLLKNGTEFH